MSVSPQLNPIIYPRVFLLFQQSTPQPSTSQVPPGKVGRRVSALGRKQPFILGAAGSQIVVLMSDCFRPGAVNQYRRRYRLLRAFCTIFDCVTDFVIPSVTGLIAVVAEKIVFDRRVVANQAVDIVLKAATEPVASVTKPLSYARILCCFT